MEFYCITCFKVYFDLFPINEYYKMNVSHADESRDINGLLSIFDSKI